MATELHGFVDSVLSATTNRELLDRYAKFTSKAYPHPYKVVAFAATYNTDYAVDGEVKGFQCCGRYPRRQGPLPGLDEGSAGWAAVQGGDIRLIEDADNPGAQMFRPGKRSDVVVGSLLCVPIGNRIGVVCLSHPQAKRLGKTDSEMHRLTAKVASMYSESLARRTRLEKAATHDPLTGALNRRGLSNQVQNLASDKSYQGDWTLYHVDADDFKNVNDELGHDQGDLVLTDLARLLEASDPQVQVVARMGGEEFVVLGKATDKWKKRARTYQGQVRLERADGKPVTVSMGAVKVSGHELREDFERFITLADRLARQAKAVHKNRVEFRLIAKDSKRWSKKCSQSRCRKTLGEHIEDGLPKRP